MFNDKKLKTTRRNLRKNQTAAEKILWSKLRRKQLNGLKFFRQYSIKRYVVDFCCPSKRVVIELDGGQHYFGTQKIKDIQRTRYIQNKGFRVIRFSNLDVLKNISGVFDKILEEITPSNSPLA